MKQYKIGCCVMLSLVAAIAAGQELEEQEDPLENVWQLQVGWVHQWGRDMKVSGPAPSLYRTLIPSRGTKWSGKPAPGTMLGPEAGLPTSWNYDDGYVFPDEQSGVTPGGDSDYPPATHYWHYQNAGQYNGGNHTLTFHRDMGTRNVGDPSMTFSNDCDDDDLPRDGIELKVSRWLHTWTDYGIDFDLVAGLAWFPDSETMRNSRAIEQKVVHVRNRYVYRDFFGSPEGGGWQPGLDNWYPFYGEYRTEDDAPGDNPVIPLDYVSGSSSTLGVVRDSVLVESEISRLRAELGLTLIKPFTSQLSAYVAPQFVLEFVEVDLDRYETVTYTDTRTGKTRIVGTRSDHEEETDVVPGFLLTAGMDYLFSEHWFVGASLGWEWLSHDVKVKVGSDTARFDLDGGEFNLYVGRTF